MKILLPGGLLELRDCKGHHGSGGEADVHPEPETVPGVVADPQCDVVLGGQLFRECHLRRLHPNNFPNGHLKVTEPPQTDQETDRQSICMLGHDTTTSVVVIISANQRLVHCSVTTTTTKLWELCVANRQDRDNGQV